MRRHFWKSKRANYTHGIIPYSYLTKPCKTCRLFPPDTFSGNLDTTHRRTELPSSGTRRTTVRRIRECFLSRRGRAVDHRRRRARRAVPSSRTAPTIPNDAGVVQHLQHDRRHRPDEPVLPEPRHQRPLVRVVPPAWRRDDGFRRARPAALRPHRRAGSDLPHGRRLELRSRHRRLDASADGATAYSLLRTRGLIRIAHRRARDRGFRRRRRRQPVRCATKPTTIAMYRRPLPSANLRFLSAVMFDGRESSPLTGHHEDRVQQLRRARS